LTIFETTQCVVFFMPMKNIIISFLVLFTSVNFLSAQTKVSGVIVDNTDLPIPYANVVFKGSKIGVVSNEDGRFYIEAPDNYGTLLVSFVGFPTKEVKLTKSVNYDFKIVLSEGKSLKEVVVYAGKTSKK